jgi:hypothetical protein
MVPRLFLLVVIIFMSASAPEAPAQVRQEPLEQIWRSRPSQAASMSTPRMSFSGAQ